MKKFFSNVFTPIKAKVSHARNRAKLMMMGAAIAALTPIGASAQNLAGTGYDAGTSALEEVASELVKYIPYVVNLCYALAGIFAVVGAISVYIAMNNEEQDVKKRPLEFMGLQGRYITWAAVTAGVGILGFMLVYALVGFLVALAFAAVSISSGIGLIMVKQRKGLYSKKNDKGIYVYAYRERL